MPGDRFDWSNRDDAPVVAYNATTDYVMTMRGGVTGALLPLATFASLDGVGNLTVPPGGRLTVNTNSGPLAQLFTTAGEGLVGTFTNHSFYLFANGTQGLAIVPSGDTYILHNGNVAGNLTVQATLTVQQVQYTWAAVAAADCYTVVLNTIDGVGNLWLHVGGVTSNVDGTGPSRRLALYADRTYVSGNLGVGVLKPLAPLHVFGNARVENASPLQQFWAPAAIADEKFWDFAMDPASHTFGIRAVTDNYSAARQAITFARGGINIGGIFMGSTVNPTQNNAFNLGDPSLLWGTVYANTPSIVTSDETQKTVRSEPTDNELDAWGDMRVVVYQMNDAIALKGADEARLHFGWISQRLEDACAAHSVDASRMAPFCKDEVTKKVKTTVSKPVQVVDEVTEDHPRIEVINGVPTMVTEPRTIYVKRTTSIQVQTPEGSLVFRQEPDPENPGATRDVPVMHDVPVMETKDVEEEHDEPDGIRYGLRYEECLVWEAAWSRRELARHAAAITALETRVQTLEFHAEG